MKEDRISKDMLEMMLSQVLTLLNAVVQRPDAPWTELLREVGQDERLSSVNTVARGRRFDNSSEIYAGHDPLYWLQYHAKHHPNWLAVVIAAGAQPADTMQEASLSTWTFAELDAKATQVAALFRTLELPEGPLALCMGRSLISIAVTVAIFRCGRTYLPIDDQLPAERKRLLIADSRCALVVTEAACLGEVEADCDCKVLNVSNELFEQNLAEAASKGSDTVRASAAPDDGAYLLYTSGSTGKPKGVLVGRANLCGFVESYAEVVSSECPATLELEGTGRYLGLAGRAFDVHLSQLFMSWRFGMALATGERALLLGDLKSTIQRLAITHMSCVPSLLDQCDLITDEVPSLVFLGVGGEKMTDRVRDTLASSLTVLNAYGPTETTIMCTVNRVRPHSHVRDIGHVLPGNTALVIDFDDKSDLTPVLRGRAGELCIRGDLVALGYHALDPAQAASSGFVTLPDGARMYRTGDAARMMVDGQIHYLGRRDEQAKIRGQRLELGEVTQCALKGAEGSINAVTFICQHKSLAKPLLVTLIAPRAKGADRSKQAELPTILAASSETGQEARKVLQYFQQHLPSYMVPDLVVPVSHLTQLPASGKTDARRLKVWLASASTSQLFAFHGSGDNNQGGNANAETERPLSPAELRVVQAMKQILPQSAVEPNAQTSIFDLGFDSLSVIRLASVLRKAGITVPIGQLRMHPRIHEIASFAAGAVGAGDADALELDLSVGQKALDTFRVRHYEKIKAVHGDRLETVLPCLPSQEGMVALSLGNSSEAIYVAQMEVRLDVARFEGGQTVSAAALRTAWKRLAQRHSILRTCFDHVDDDTLAQIVLRGINPEQHFVDPSASDVVREVLQNISSTPPWRVTARRDGDAVTSFVLHVHHALYDGHSLRLLLDDLVRVLKINSVNENGDSDEAEAKEQPEVEDLLKSVLSVPLDRAETFWRGTFAGFPSTEQSPWQHFASAPALRSKATIRLSALESAAKHLQITLSSLVAAALGVAFCRPLDTTAFTIGFVLWGRSVDLPSADKIVTPCLTTVPMPFTRCVGGISRLGDVVRACHTWNSSCLSFQHTSMRQIRSWVGLERQGSLVDLLYSFVQLSERRNSQDRQEWYLDQVEAETDAPAAVEAVADPARDELRISAVVKHALPEDGLEGVVERLRILLERIASGTGGDLSLQAMEVPMISTTQDAGPRTFSQDPQRSMTATEEKIHRLAVTMCGMQSAETLTLDTPLIRIGLDSIVALRFSSRLRRECGLQLSAHDILSGGTIAGLSRLLSERQVSVNEKADSANTKETSSERYKATPLQAGMLNGTLSSSSHDLYVHHHAVKLDAGVDEEKLKQALQRVVAAHEILRTGFRLESAEQGGQGSLSWYGQVTPYKALSNAPQLRRLDYDLPTSLALDNFGADFTFSKPEDFAASPWRAAVLGCAEEQKLLVISMHHSLYDGVSLPALFADLRSAYLEAAAPLLDRSPFSHVAKVIASTADESVLHWQRTLDGYRQPSLLLPVRASQSSPYRLHELRIPLSLSSFKQLGADLGATPQAIAMLSWAKVLAMSSGQRDVCFGQVVSGRYLSIPGIEDVSGPLINTVPIRIKLDSELASHAATARKLQADIVAAQPFQHASLARIQNAWRRNVGANKTLLDTLFVFHNVERQSGGSMESKSALWTSLDSSADGTSATVTAASEYPVNISVIQDDEGVQIKAGASDAVGGAEWLPKTLKLLEEVMLDTLHRPQRSLGAFPEGFAALPLEAAPAESQEQSNDVSRVADGRRSLTAAEQAIVLRHMAKRMNVDEDTIKSCPNLFLLGMDSLLAIYIAADGRAEQIPLTPFDLLSAEMFVKLTVAAETQHLNDATSSAHAKPGTLVSREAQEEARELLHLPACDVEAVLPLMTGQKQHIELWLQRGRRFLEPTFVYASEGKLDVQAMEAAWTELRRRNAALRTAFVRLKDRQTLVQVVLVEESAIWKDLPRSQLALVDGEDDVDAAAFEAVKRLNAMPTDLSRPSPRLTLVQGKEKDLVLITVYHTSYDAWSMRLMAAELGQLYRHCARGELSSMRTPVSFTKFVSDTHREAHRLKQAARAYWERTLRNASPTLVCRGAKQSIQQTLAVRKSALEGVDQMETACHRHGLGLQVVVILAYARLLSSRASGEQPASPTFGFYTAGRSSALEGVSELMGPTTAMQPMTVALTPEGPESLVAQLRAIQKDLISRAQYEQSNVPSPVAFDAHLNLLWHKPAPAAVSGSTVNGEKVALLKPYKLPYDSGYFTRHPEMPGKTSVDGGASQAEVGSAQLYMDVGMDRAAGSLSVGARCDSSAMNAQGLEAFCDELVSEIANIGEGL
ncbi:hypothetical protein NDA16_000012 [Ustilago loliicola]|nr:hypothetical protein NDA16_000012 [Ustilago loliicola]